MRSFMRMLSGIIVLGLASGAGAATYPGNGGAGFGGPIGTGNLSVTDDGAGNLNFSLTPGTAFSGNALVLYIDSKTGGINDTSTLTDNSDPGRTAIAGLSNNGRTLAIFPAGFNADFAATVEPGVFGGLFDLSNPAAYPFVASGGLSGAGTGPFTFSYTRAQLGLARPIRSPLSVR